MGHCCVCAKERHWFLFKIKPYIPAYAEAWILVETVCHLTQLVFFVTQKLTCFRPLPRLTHDGTFHLEPCLLDESESQGPLCNPTISASVLFPIWTGSLAPAVPQLSPSLSQTSCHHPLSLLVVRFSGDWMQRRLRTSHCPCPVSPE
jgi:hypothetical protein